MLSINNLLKPLLSKPETKLIQRKYETILSLKNARFLERLNEENLFFGSHDTYVATYEAIYVSTKN